MTLEKILQLLQSTLLIGLLIVAIGVGLGRKLVIWAWKPARNVIEQATNSNNLTADVINATPNELRPIISHLFKSYRSITVAELHDEMLHNFKESVSGKELSFKIGKRP